MAATLANASPRRRLRILRRPSETIRPAMPRPQRRDCHGRLGALLQALAGHEAELTDASFRPWCSATFTGAQHRFTLRFAGGDASQNAHRFAQRAPEAELPVPGHIAADLVVDAVRTLEDHVLVDLAVLTIEDW